MTLRTVDASLSLNDLNVCYACRSVLVHHNTILAEQQCEKFTQAQSFISILLSKCTRLIDLTLKTHQISFRWNMPPGPPTRGAEVHPTIVSQKPVGNTEDFAVPFWQADSTRLRYFNLKTPSQKQSGIKSSLTIKKALSSIKERKVNVELTCPVNYGSMFDLRTKGFVQLGNDLGLFPQASMLTCKPVYRWIICEYASLLAC